MSNPLRTIRKNSPLETNDILIAMDIQSSTLYSWETGNRLIPINQLYKLLELYNYPIEHFDFKQLIELYELKKQVNA